MYISNGKLAINPRHSELTDCGIVRKIAAEKDMYRSYLKEHYGLSDEQLDTGDTLKMNGMYHCHKHKGHGFSNDCIECKAE